jgi:hypothetical protein
MRAHEPAGRASGTGLVPATTGLRGSERPAEMAGALRPRDEVEAGQAAGRVPSRGGREQPICANPSGARLAERAGHASRPTRRLARARARRGGARAGAMPAVWARRRAARRRQSSASQPLIPGRATDALVCVHVEQPAQRRVGEPAGEHARGSGRRAASSNTVRGRGASTDSAASRRRGSPVRANAGAGAIGSRHSRARSTRCRFPVRAPAWRAVRRATAPARPRRVPTPVAAPPRRRRGHVAWPPCFAHGARAPSVAAQQPADRVGFEEHARGPGCVDTAASLESASPGERVTRSASSCGTAR